MSLAFGAVLAALVVLVVVLTILGVSLFRSVKSLGRKVGAVSDQLADASAALETATARLPRSGE